jgi:hypothetical protein
LQQSLRPPIGQTGEITSSAYVCELRNNSWFSRAFFTWRKFNAPQARGYQSLIKLKIAVFSPIPSVRMITAEKVNPGDLQTRPNQRSGFLATNSHE